MDMSCPEFEMWIQNFWLTPFHANADDNQAIEVEKDLDRLIANIQIKPVLMIKWCTFKTPLDGATLPEDTWEHFMLRLDWDTW